MTHDGIVADPQKVIADLFQEKLSLNVSVEKREYPEETIYIVKVPQEDMNRAVELGIQIDQLLAKSGINGFVTIRANLEGDQLTEHVGEAAENKARDWLGLGHITAHRPERDKRGWDFLLEYDLTSDNQKPLEQTEPIVTCKLQVKGTVLDSGGVDIKLSNWDKMVKQPLPFFVLVIVFDKSNLESVTASYLVHIGEEYMSQVLKRLRGLSDRERNKLHEKTLRIAWSEKDKLNPDHYGRSIGNKIREHIGTSAEAYIIKKLGWLKRLGYDDKPMQGHILFHCPDNDSSKLYNQLADLATGVLKELPINNIAMEEVRFGISKPIDMLRGVDASSLEKLSISIDPVPSVGESIVTISDLRHEHAVSVTCKTYQASAIFPFLRPLNEKFRLVSPFITFVMEAPTTADPKRAHIRFGIQIPFDEKIELEQFLKSAKAVRLLQGERKNGLFLDVGFTAEVGKSKSQQPRSVSAPLGPYDFNVAPDTDAMLSLAEHLDYFYGYFQLDSHIEIRLSNLIKQSRPLAALHMLLKPMAMKSSELDVSYSNNTAQSGAGKKTACIVSSMALVGNYILVAVGIISGVSEIIVSESKPGIEMLHITNPSYEFIKHMQKIMHEGETYSIEPFIDECVTELLKRDYDIVLNPANEQMIRRASDGQAGRPA